MSTNDGIEIQMNYINEEYPDINDLPKDDKNENNDTPNPNIIIDNKKDYDKIEEQPYYEQKDKIESENSEQSSNLCSRIKAKVLDNNESNKLLFYSLKNLLIQVIFIFIFSLLGFILGINEAFVEHPAANLIPTTLTMIILYIIVLAKCMEATDHFSFYVNIVLYVPCIVFYSFALSGVTDKIHVICGQVLYLLDILSFMITLLIYEFGLKMYILFGIISGLISIVVLIIFHFKYIYDDLITFIISTVGLSEIIYLIIVSLGVKKYVYKTEYRYGTAVFDYAIFTPVILLILGFFAQ